MTRLVDREFHSQLEALERGEALREDLPADDAADLALAGRLLSLRAQPSARLQAQVQEALAAQPARSGWAALASRVPRFGGRRPAWQRVALAVAALVLVLGTTMLLSPGVRATVLELISKIGGITFVQSEEYPQTPEQRRGGWMNLYDTTPGDPGFQPLPEQNVTLAQASSILPFSYTLPAWAPEGFVLQDNVRVILPSAEFTPTVAVWTWERSSGGSPVYLSALYTPNADYAPLMVVGTTGVERVQVGDHEAALVRGAWNVDSKQYGAPDLLDLRWQEGPVVFSLVGSAPQVSAADLIRMAEAMP